MTSPTLARLPAIPSVIRTLTNDQSRMLDLRYPMARATVARCVTCGGTRRFRWIDAEGNEVDYECSCIDQCVLSRWLWHSGVLARWQRLGWRDFEVLDPKACNDALEYIDNITAYAKSGIGLTLTGPKGTGKTLLAHLILKEAIAKGRDCYATTFTAMIDEFARGWSKTPEGQEQARWFDRRVRDAGLLFIDDLGRERNKGDGSVGENMLETVIRHRTACLLPTIITTNIEHDQIEQAYGGHTVSLLSEVAKHIAVPGLDSRNKMKEREMDYIKRGLTRPVTLG